MDGAQRAFRGRPVAKGRKTGFGHRSDARTLSRLRKAGADPVCIGPHHWRLSKSPLIDWWPSSGKYVIGDSGALAAYDFRDFLADVADALAVRCTPCGVCGMPVKEAGRANHDDCLMRASFGAAAGPYVDGQP